jgi:hypothetical protein
VENGILKLKTGFSLMGSGAGGGGGGDGLAHAIFPEKSSAYQMIK